MFKRLSCIGLFLAWLCASGAFLDTTQVFAWARMFTGYARTMSIEEAAAHTMDPEKPCAICMAVRRAREAQRHQQPAATSVSVEKMLLAHVHDEPLILLPVRPEWPAANPVPVRSWRTPVPVPPPRALIRGFIG
jgi:hypothetical protein